MLWIEFDNNSSNSAIGGYLQCKAGREHGGRRKHSLLAIIDKSRPDGYFWANNTYRNDIRMHNGVTLGFVLTTHLQGPLMGPLSGT